MSIATELIESVLDALADHPKARVEAVELRLGRMRLIVPEALETAWSAVSAGTVAQDSELRMLETPIRARCRLCGEEFSPPEDNFICPSCGQADVDIIEGNEILLTSLELAEA